MKRVLLFLGPFVVHQLFDRPARRAPGTPAEPHGDDQAEKRVSPGNAAILIERQRGDNRQIEQQIRLIMDMIGGDGETAGAADDMPLPGQQRQSRRHGDQRDGNALARRCVRPPPSNSSIARNSKPSAEIEISTT